VFTVLCVLKSGGIYDGEWVRRLHDAVARNLSKPHGFACLSDVDVPCRRIALQHEWEGWWSKIEIFKPGVVVGPTLYLDLDTAITGPLDDICKLPHDFSMLNNFSNPGMVGSGVMWFSGDNIPHGVYQKFSRQPDAYIAHHNRNANGSYLGDQAFVWDALDRDVPFLTDDYPGIKSYKHHCRSGLPKGTSIVCFPGAPKPTDVTDQWLIDAWR
jgi:hypothetical protein